MACATCIGVLPATRKPSAAYDASLPPVALPVCKPWYLANQCANHSLDLQCSACRARLGSHLVLHRPSNRRRCPRD